MPVTHLYNERKTFDLVKNFQQLYIMPFLNNIPLTTPQCNLPLFFRRIEWQMMILIRNLRALKFTWIYVVFAISTANTGFWVTGAVTTRTLVLAAHINVPVKCLRSLYQ